MLNKTIRSTLSLLLVFCLLFGMSGNAIAMAIGDSASRAVDKIDKEVETIIADLRDTIANLDAKVKEQETTLNNGKAELTEAEAKLDAAEIELEEAEANLLIYGGTPEMLAKVEEALAKVHAAQAEVAEAQKLVEEAEKTLALAESTIADAYKAIDNVEKTYEDLRAALADPHVSVAYVEETVKELRNNVDALWQSILDLETSVDELIEAYAALENAETDAVDVPEMPKELTELAELLDKAIAIAVTLNEALDYFVAAAEKVLEVTEGALRRIYNVLKNNLSRDMHKKVYNWLYNNPDKVCELVKEFGVFGLEKLVHYGPYALDLLNNYYDLTVRGMKLTAKGAYLTATLGAKALGYLGDRFDFVDEFGQNIAEALSKLYAKYGDEAKDLAKVYVDYLDLKDRYYNATHAEYTIYDDSKLLVIGDRSAAAGYAELLAKMLYENNGFAVTPFFNSTVDMKTDWSNTTKNVVDQLDDWAGLVADADLITVGFGNMTAVRDMIDGLLSEKFEKDWSKLVGDTAAELVQKTLNQIEMELKANGVSQSSIDTVMLAAQHYAYTYAQQLVNYPKLINKLQALNKDAQIVIVGAYNELDDITVLVAGREIAIAKYVQPLIDAMNLQNLAEGFFEENVIYVHAPEVKNEGGKMTFNLDKEEDLLDFVFATEDDYLMMPDLASQEYVAQKIYEALTITDKRTTEEPVPPTTTPDEPTVPTEPTEPDEPTVPSEPPVDDCPHLYKFVVQRVCYYEAENCLEHDLWWKRVVCFDCGQEWIIYYEGEAGSHNWSEWQLIFDGGLNNYSTFARDCSVCGAHEEKNVWVSCDHNWVPYENSYVAQNCQEYSWTEIGEQCTKCGEIAVYDFQFQGWGEHDWTEWAVTPWNEYFEFRTCNFCGAYEERRIGCGHWWYEILEEEWYEAKNCQERDSYTFTAFCYECGETFTETYYYDYGDHVYGEWYPLWEYDYGYAKNGYYARDCQYCDYTDYEWRWTECDHDWEPYEYSHDAYYCSQSSWREWGERCTKCGMYDMHGYEEYGVGEHHYWTSWYYYDEDTDWRYCWYCGETEYREVGCRHMNGYWFTEQVYGEHCQEMGYEYEYFHCNDCGQNIYTGWSWELGYGPHQIDVNVYQHKPSNCLEWGYVEIVHTCKQCGETLYYESWNTYRGEHDWSDWMPSYFENDEGWYYRECYLCGEQEWYYDGECQHFYSRLIDIETIYGANCQENNRRVYTYECYDCGEIWTRERILSSTGPHHYGEWYTVEVYGNYEIQRRDCEFCDNYRTRYFYYGCDHSNTYEEIFYHYDAENCLSSDIYYYDVFCADCGQWLDWYYEYGERGPHNWSEWNVYQLPTATEYGWEYRLCQICNEIEWRQIDPTGEIPDDCKHENLYDSFENVVDADCVNGGSYDVVIYCDDCGLEMSRETIYTDALGHIFGSWELHKLPTCTERGELRRYCDRCDCFESIELPALNEFDVDVPDYRDEIMDLLRKIYDFLGDEVFNLMSTSGDYNIGCNSMYVAIGDSTAVAGGYAEMLAEMLNVPNMENLSEYGLTVNEAIGLVGQNAELISNADLITLGFSNLAASVDMLNALNGMYNADWSDAIGETAAKAVEKALAELKQQLIQEGYDDETVNMILDAANTYAYAYAARALRYPDLVKAVREVNPNALIVIVGAYNDLEDVVVDVNGRNVNIGKLADYLIYAANFESLLMAKYADNVVYAHAPEVETVFDTMDYENLNNLGYLMSLLNDEMLPTDAGHAYIAEQIYKTLNVTHNMHPDLIEVIENVIQPDCENMGSYDKVIYCGVCGMELYRETIYVDALGHNFGCWQLHKVPTFHQEGELRRYCDRCGCYESITLPALWNPDFDFDFDYRDEFMDMLRKLYDLVGDKLFELAYDATHADYTIFHDSLYVAIGDSTALSDSYVDDLAELLEIPHMMENLAQPGLTVSDAIDLVGENADLISKADLITLGFSNIAASVDMLNALNGMYTADWSDAVGENAAQTIDKALSELKDQLIQEGMDAETVNMVLDAANAYAYAYAARAMRYPALVEAVREVNPDALIVLVGAYNDLEGVVVDVNGRQVNVGKYAEYLIYAANLENLLQAIHGDDVIYVHAPEVETIFEENDYQNLNNLGYLMSILNDEMLPSEAGHEYIAQKIFEALTVKYAIWGDVNGDRKVNCRDARLILKYAAGLIDETGLDLTWADVNGDGKVNTRDARLILRLRAGEIEHFPVCKLSEE